MVSFQNHIILNVPVILNRYIQQQLPTPPDNIRTSDRLGKLLQKYLTMTTSRRGGPSSASAKENILNFDIVDPPPNQTTEQRVDCLYSVGKDNQSSVFLLVQVFWLCCRFRRACSGNDLNFKLNHRHPGHHSFEQQAHG